MYPAAAAVGYLSGDYPLSRIIENGRIWGAKVHLLCEPFLQSYACKRGPGNGVLAVFLEMVSKLCGIDTLFLVLVSCPDFCFQ
jgi:hypothetical protein